MQDQDQVPESTFVTIYFILLGAGTNVTWTAVVNSLDYFSDKYPGEHITYLVPIAMYVGKFIACLCVTKLSAYFSFNLRVICSLGIIAPMLVLLPVAATLEQGTTEGVWLIMLMLFVLGFLAATCSSTVMGVASQLPSKYTSCFFVGTTLVALMMGLLREMSSLIFQSRTFGSDTSVIVFFGVAMSILITCISVQPRFSRSETYVKQCVQAAKVRVGDAENKQALKDDPSSDHFQVKRTFGTLLRIFLETKVCAILLITTSIQFHLVYPGVMLAKEISTVSAEIKNVTMVLTFSVLQTVGKIVGQYKKYYTIVSVAVIIVFRFALIAFFIIQARGPTDVVFGSIWFGYLNIAVFGLTTGFAIVSLCIIGPEKVVPKKKEIAGYVSMLCIYVGDLLGVLLALPLAGIGH